MLIFIIIVFLVSVAIGLPIAKFQNKVIDDCFSVCALHDKLTSGDIKFSDLSDTELFSLERPLFTSVGMGGIGPQYSPSYFVLTGVWSEFFRRRELI